MKKQLLQELHEPIKFIKTLHDLGFEDAIIAGGVIRDIYANQWWKDIDIFIQDPNCRREVCLDFRNNEILSKYLHLNSRDQITKSWDQLYTNSKLNSNNQITYIADVLKNLIPYQLIFIRTDPITYVRDHFDLGICKTYCDGSRIRMFPEFINDFQQKTFTICGKHMTKDTITHSLKDHIPRIQGKFPGFTTVLNKQNHDIMKK